MGDGEAVYLSFGTHTKVICGLELDSISHPSASEMGMGELHLERRGFSLSGFNVRQSFLDCNFSGCEEK